MTSDRFAAARADRRRGALRGLRPVSVPSVGRKTRSGGSSACWCRRPVEPTERALSCRTECVVAPRPGSPAPPACTRAVPASAGALAGPAARAAAVGPVDPSSRRDAVLRPWDEAVEHEIDCPSSTCCRSPRRGVRSSSSSRPAPRRARTGPRGRLSGSARARGGRRPASCECGAWAAGPADLLHRGDCREHDRLVEPGATRDDGDRRSLVAVHTLLAVDDGASCRCSIRPPTRRRAVAGCTNGHVPGARSATTARPTWCSRRRSSSTTTRRSHPRAPATSSTPPRSTRSSRCACSR